MKRSSWSLAGPLVAAMAMAAIQTQAGGAEEGSTGFGGVGPSRSDTVCVEGASPNETDRSRSAEAVLDAHARVRALQQTPYFSVDKRHRPAWWRSASYASCDETNRRAAATIVEGVPGCPL